MERFVSGGEEEFIEFSAVAEENDNWTIVLDQFDLLHYGLMEFGLWYYGIAISSPVVYSEGRGNCELIENFVAICELPLFVLWENLQCASDSEDGLEVIGQLSVGELCNHQSNLQCLSQIVIGDVVA